MHAMQSISIFNKERNQTKDSTSLSANSTHCSTSASCERSSILQIIPVTFSKESKSNNTSAFLHNGSVVSRKLTKTASAHGTVLSENSKHTEPHKGIHGTKSVKYTNVTLSIKGMNSIQTFNMKDVQVSADIKFPQYNLTWIRKVCEQHEHLKHITYPDVDTNQISILHGCDNFDLIAPKEIHNGPPNTARALQTKLGWSASGKTDLPSAATCQSQIVKNESRQCSKTDDILYNEVQNWYKVENLPSDRDLTKSDTDKRSSEILESTVEFMEGQY